jgi:hypothetical protein
MATLATARGPLNCSERFRGKPGIMTGGITLVADGYEYSYGPRYGPSYGPSYGPRYGPRYGPSDGHSHVQLVGCALRLDDE